MCLQLEITRSLTTEEIEKLREEVTLESDRMKAYRAHHEEELRLLMGEISKMRAETHQELARKVCVCGLLRYVMSLPPQEAQLQNTELRLAKAEQLNQQLSTESLSYRPLESYSNSLSSQLVRLLGKVLCVCVSVYVHVNITVNVFSCRQADSIPFE